MSIVSKIRGFGLGLVIWILAVPIFLFTLFPLVSCTSSGTAGIWLVETLASDKPTMWLKVGYYGLCLSEGSKNSCYGTTGVSAHDLGKHWNMTDDDSQELIKLALKFQHDVFVAFMTAGGIDWFVSLVLASLLVVRGGRAGRVLRLAAKITALSAAMLMFASAWATDAAGAALVAVADSSSFHRGTLLVALQWIAAILSFFHAWAVTGIADSESGGKGADIYRM